MLHAVSIAVVLQLSNLSGAPAAGVSRAQAEVVRIYAATGVSMEWTPEAPAANVRSIHVILVDLESGDLRRIGDTVMGAAVWTPLGNGLAYVFYRRVEEHAALHNAPPERVLACAMIHEIGHLLGTRGHSRTGVMRAGWRESEFRRAAAGVLGFSASDIAMLHSDLSSPARGR